MSRHSTDRHQRQRRPRAVRVATQLLAVASCGALLSAAGAPTMAGNRTASPSAVAIARTAPNPAHPSPAALPHRAVPGPPAARATPARHVMPADLRAPPPRLGTPTATSSPVATPPAPTPTSTPPAPTPAGSSKPGPGNTGVPAGTTLTPRYGDLYITTAGATLDALDIHGFVFVEAPNVTIKRSIIRGGRATSGNVGLVNDADARGANFRLLDSELVPAYPSVYLDGIKGSQYSLARVDIHGTVDAAKVFGDNVTIQASWLHDTVHYASDPNQGGGPSHNDGVQVLSGTNIHVLDNTITGSDNAAMQVTQGNGAVSGLLFDGNWADAGGCSVNITNSPLPAISGITLSNNRFGPSIRVPNCPMIATVRSTVSAYGNVWDSTGQPVGVRYA